MKLKRLQAEGEKLTAEKAGGASVEVQNDRPTNSKPLKEKSSKAERRALQEAQRAAKAASKGTYCYFFFMPMSFVKMTSCSTNCVCIFHCTQLSVCIHLKLSLFCKKDSKPK